MAKELVKQWYDILAPKYFGNKVLGQTIALDPTKLTGRVVEVSLAELTGEASKYYMKLFFKVNSVEGPKLLTIFSGHDCTRDFIARVVQIGTDRIDTTDIVQLKDGKLKVKALTVTNGAVRRGIEKNIRKSVKDTIAKEISAMTIEEFIKSMITGTLQKKIRKDINKIYPLRQFEFRKTELL